MAVLENVLSKIIEIQKNHKLEFTIHFANNQYYLENVIIFKSNTSLSKPSVKGGIYFSDVNEFKMKGTINDLSIIPLLTKCMLGPNNEFMELKVYTNAVFENSQKNITFLVHLTNTIQRTSNIELSMRIIQIIF